MLYLSVRTRPYRKTGHPYPFLRKNGSGFLTITFVAAAVDIIEEEVRDQKDENDNDETRSVETFIVLVYYMVSIRLCTG